MSINRLILKRYVRFIPVAFISVTDTGTTGSTLKSRSYSKPPLSNNLYHRATPAINHSII